MNRHIPPITKTLIIANVLLFLLSFLLESSGIKLELVLGAFFPGSPNFHLHQIITHMFMHGNFAHILFNMIALWSFGSAIEIVLGAKKYATFYFICGIGSYCLFNVVNYIQINGLVDSLFSQGTDIEHIFNISKRNINGEFVGEMSLTTRIIGNTGEIMKLFSFLITPMVGASGAIYGLLVAFALLYPNARIMLLIPPIPIKAKYLMPVLILIELYLGTNNFKGDNVAHFAHLGGALIGFILIRIWTKNRFRINY